MSSSISDDEERWGRVGNGLNTINRFLQKYLYEQLRTFFHNLPTITDPNNPFNGCLKDSNGEPLRFAPENHPTPPNGDGVQLCYRALPDYEATVQLRKQKLQQAQIHLQPQQIQKLQSKSQPVPIKNEHHLSFLFLQEYYNKQSGCDIFKLDASAILNILSKAPCFPSHIKNQSGKVRDQVRNKWAHGIIQDWTTTQLQEAFVQLNKLAGMMSNNAGLIKELDEDCKGSKPLDFPKKSFLLKLNKYRTHIKTGELKKVEKAIKKLEPVKYLERYFKHSTTGSIDSEIENVLLSNTTTLLNGQAGSGKSTVASKAIKLWSEGKHMKDITCCLFLSAGSEEKIPLYKLIWDDYDDACRWSENEIKEAYNHLQALADEGKLAIIIDCLDAFESLTSKDIEDASRAAIHPSLPVNMKTACVGILNRKIFPGAKVLGTGRYMEMINKEVLENKAHMIELVDMTKDDRTKLIDMMESDPEERKRVQGELHKISTDDAIYLKAPQIARNIIQLIIEGKVDTKTLHFSSAQYLKILISNLSFHNNQNSRLTEFIYDEDREFLMRCMKLCQIQVQNSHIGINNVTIEGIQRNIQNIGQCFEFKQMGKTIQIPLEFIKKLGIFNYENEEGVINLDSIHQPFLDFFCAGSLCRRNVDIEYELSMIKDKARFESVVIFLAGLLSKNNSSQDICQNYLELLENDDPEKVTQGMYKAILSYPLTEHGSDAIISVDGNDIKMRLEMENFILLNKALEASTRNINFQLNKLILPIDKKWTDYENLLKLIEFQEDDISCLKTVIPTHVTQIDDSQNKAKNEQRKNEYSEDTINFIENYVSNVLSNNIPQVSIPSLIFKPSTSKQEKEILFVPRKFAIVNDLKMNDAKELQDFDSVKTFDNIEDIFEPGRPCLLQGEAGIGKSYFSSYMMSQWASKQVLKKCKLCILLPCRNLDKKARLSKADMVFQFSSLKGSMGIWKLTFSELEKLANNEDLGILIDGLDELQSISLSELGDIVTKVDEASKDPEVRLTALELIIGILRKQIFNDCTVVGTGRPNAVNAVSANLLDNCATVVHLLEFTEKNVADTVHIIGCSGDKECINDPLPLCQGILKCFAENNQITTMARNPALCTSLIKLFMDKIGKKEHIAFESYSGCSLRLEILLRNIFHKHSHKDQDISFTTLDTDMANAVYHAAMLCCKSLVRGDVIIKGTKKKIGREEHFVPKVTKSPISLENLQKMDIFRIIQCEYGQMAVEAIHLSIQEILTAGFLCSQHLDKVLESLAKFNSERLEAVLTYMCGLLKEKNPIDVNFLEFLQEKTQVFPDNEDLIQKLYSFILNLPEKSNTDVKESFKMAGFLCYYNNKKLNDYQLHLISKMVAISEVPCPGIIIAGCDEKEKETQNQEWTLLFKGLSNRTSISRAKDVLKFLDLHTSPPKEIQIDEDCRKGMCSIVKQFLESHHNVNMALIGGYQSVELFTQNDVYSYVWLTEKGHIKPSQLWRLTCSVKIDNSIISRLIPAMVDVKHIIIECDQTNTFWESMKQANQKWMVKSLDLANIVLNDNIIDCASNVERLYLRKMKLDVTACDGLATSLCRNHCKTEEIHLDGITVHDGAASAFSKCFKKFTKIVMKNMQITAAFAVGLCWEGINAKEIELSYITFEDESAETFGKCFKNVKTISLGYTEITAAFNSGLCQDDNKTEELVLSGLTFEDRTAESFVKHFKTVNRITIQNMKITAAFAIGLSLEVINAEEIELNNVTFEDEGAETFGKCFKNVKTISLNYMEITAAFNSGLSQDGNKTEELVLSGLTFEDIIAESFVKYFKTINRISIHYMEITAAFNAALCQNGNNTKELVLSGLTFEDRNAESFAKCFKTFKKISIQNMEITAAFNAGLCQNDNSIEELVLYEVRFGDRTAESFAKGFKNVKSISIRNMEITAGLICEDSKTESVELDNVTFEKGAAESFVKCFENVQRISLTQMKITKAFAVGLSCGGSEPESICLDEVTFEDESAESYAKCLGNAKTMIFRNMKVIEEFALGLSKECSETKSIHLDKVIFEDGAAELFVKFLGNVKSVSLQNTRITESISVGLSREANKTESVHLNEVTFENETAELFIKYFEHVKLITLRKIKITEAFAVALKQVGCKTDSIFLDINEITIVDEAVESFVKSFGNGKTIQLRNINVTESFAVIMSQEDSKIESIYLDKIKYEGKAVQSFAKCFKKFKHITMRKMEISETFAEGLSWEDSKTETIDLDCISFEGRAAELFSNCFKTVKKIILGSMKITPAFATGLSSDGSKIESIELNEIKFDNETIELFRKCSENIKTITLRKMVITAAFTMEFSKNDRKTESIQLDNVAFEDGAAEPFFKSLKNTKKKIRLSSKELSVSMCDTLAVAFRERIEQVTLSDIKFADGAFELFSKYMRNIENIRLWFETEITEAFAGELKFIDGIFLGFMTLDCTVCDSLATAISQGDSKTKTIEVDHVKFANGAGKLFSKCFRNIKTMKLTAMKIPVAIAKELYNVEQISLIHMELDINTCESLVAALSQEDSQTKIIELIRIKFINGADKSFSKCFGHIKTIDLTNMEIPLPIALELYRVEKIILAGRELDVTSCESLVAPLSRDDCETEKIELQRITFAEGAVKSFKQCLKNIKEISLEEMLVTGAFAKELCQEDDNRELLKLTKIEVENTDEAIESFVNLVVNTKEVEMVQMNLKEAQLDAVANALNNIEDKKIKKITVNSSFSSRINASTGICIIAAEE